MLYFHPGVMRCSNLLSCLLLFLNISPSVERGRIGRKEGDQAVDDAYVNPRREASTARAASFVQGGETSQAEEGSRSTLSWK